MSTPKIRRPSGPLGGDTLEIDADATLVLGGTTYTGADLAASVEDHAETARAIAIPLIGMSPIAAVKDSLPDSPNGTSLGLSDTAGGALTGSTTNSGGTASASESAGFVAVLPTNYVAGGAVTIRVRAKVSAARQVTQTIDATIKKQGDATLGSDIVATAAQTLTTSYANYDFTVTPTGLAAGDVLVGTIVAAADDTGGGNNGAITVTAVTILATTSG